MSASPVFLLASERSGTNLLRRRISAFQRDLCGPPPIHILKILYDVAPYYGDLSADDAFRALVGDGLRLCYEHFSPWDVRFEVRQIEQAHWDLFGKRRSVVALMHTLYTCYARAKGCGSYLCKDNNLFDYGPQILWDIPDAGFIYLYRDPRDCVASQLARPRQTSSSVRLAELWRDEQITSIAFVSQGKAGKLLRVSYEALVSDEERTLNRICEHFGLRSRETGSMPNAEEQTHVHEWKNLDRQTIRDNFGKYRTSLTERQVRTVEGIAWHQLKWLEYRPENAARPSIGTLRRIWDREFHIVLDALRRRTTVVKLTEGQRRMDDAVRAIRSRAL